jgi:hypothetical protein
MLFYIVQITYSTIAWYEYLLMVVYIIIIDILHFRQTLKVVNHKYTEYWLTYKRSNIKKYIAERFC